MKIKSVYIENFGKLSKFSYDFSDGLNSFAGKNGWGKTTLTVFIKAMLYGMEYSRKDELSELKHYKPWNNGKYGGNLIFEFKGNEYKIIRFFGDKKSQEFVEIYEMDSNKKTDCFGKNPGLSLFGIDRDSFERSVFIFLDEKKVPFPTDSINAKLNDLISDNDENGNFLAAEKILNDAINTYSSTRKSDAKIPSIKNKISDLKEKVFLCEASEKNIEILEQSLNEQKINLNKIQSGIKLLETRQKIFEDKILSEEQKILYENLKQKFHNKNCSEEKIYSYVKKLDKISEIKNKKNVLEMNFTKSEGKAKKTSVGKILFNIFFCLFSLASILSGVYGFVKLHNILLSCLSGIFLAIFIASLFAVNIFYRKKNLNLEFENSDSEDFKEQIKKLNADEEKIEEEISSFIKNISENVDVKNAGFELNQILNDFYVYKKLSEKVTELEKLSEKMNLKTDDIFEMLNSLNEKKSLLEKNIFNLEHNIETEKEVADEKNNYLLEISNLENQLKTAESELEIFEKTKEFLIQANENLSKKYSAKMKKSFNKYISYFLGQEAFILDSEMGVKKEEGGAMYSSEYLSSGYKDIVNFCLRLALFDSMFDKEKPPLILDDPFVNFDDEKNKMALGVLKNISSETQILYFTCSKNRVY